MNESVLGHDYFMRQAIIEARKAFDRDEVPIGAVVVCQDRIIARAHNLTQTLNDVTAHAEMQAITAATNVLGGKYLTDCTLYVTVEPCPMCAGGLLWAQLSRLVYGVADEKRGAHLYSPHIYHKKTEIIQGILKEECEAMMTDFFKNKR